MLNANISLEGYYTAQVFSKDGTLRHTIGPHHNFITSTGLSMISKYAIADCFRFVSFGLSNASNTIKESVNNGWGTINLTQPSKYTYIGSRTDFSDPTTSEYSNHSYKERPSGITLTRAWRVPAGKTDYFDQGYSFEEIMLSPGEPAATGLDNNLQWPVGAISITSWSSRTLFSFAAQSITNNQLVGQYVAISDAYTSTSWIGLIAGNTASTITLAYSYPYALSHPGGSVSDWFSFSVYGIGSACSSSDYFTDWQGNTVYGNDASAIASYYSQTVFPHTPTCADTGAFIRIVKEIPVLAGDFLTFSYSLDINVDTGINKFVLPYGAGLVNSRGAGNANTNWAIHALSGVSNLINHGVKYICSTDTMYSTGPAGQEMTQVPSYNTSYEVGESYIGPWGCPLEPSCPANNLRAYLTTDNLQFFTNAVEGGKDVAGQIGHTGSLSGLMAFQQTPFASNVGGWDTRLYNIRRNDQGSLGVASTPSWPLASNYTNETTTPSSALAGFDSVPLDQYGGGAYGGTSVSYLPFAHPSNRFRQVNRSFSFLGNTAQAYNFNFLPCRGIVLSYIDASYPDYHAPYLDSLFTDSGAMLLPLVTNKYSYTYSDVYNKYWYYLEGTTPLGDFPGTPGMLTFSFTETWSSPCTSDDADGC